MRRAWALPAASALAAAAACGALAGCIGSRGESASAANSPVRTTTARVERGTLVASLSQTGILTYDAGADGAPDAVINHARGVFTKLPAAGDRVACGAALYRVDDRPVLLLCGPVPSYRDLQLGDRGRDVRQLNANLHRLGFDARAGISSRDDDYSWKTQLAVRALQRNHGLPTTGALELDDAVVLAAAARIAKVSVDLGAAARPGARLAQATSDALQVRVNLSPTQQNAVSPGDRVRITLPDHRLARGTVARLGAVVRGSGDPGAGAAAAAFPAYIRLDQPQQARGLGEAPVHVEISTRSVADVLSVPAIALVGNAGGGFAVEAVRVDGRRALVAVKLGLVDAAAGRVQIDGDLRAGDQVVVPSS